MKDKKPFLLFSHGFGNRWDDRGLFPDVIDALGASQYRMFDYNIVNEEKNELTVRPLNHQVQMLKNELDGLQVKSKNDVVLIGHSQGCLIPAILKPSNIRKAIFLAPQHNISIERMINTFKDRPGSKIDLSGTSVFARRDGSRTLVPQEYWKSLENIDPIQLFNEFSLKTDLIIVVSTEDEILGKTDFSGISQRIKIINIPTNHDFTGEGRAILLEKMKTLI